MFCGIVETTGTLTQLTTELGCKHFTITPLVPFTDLHIGDSISVNGVCLTITAFSHHTFNITAVPETLRLTNLDKLAAGDLVNLERSMQLSTRIGGHYVQGHVDGMAQILELTQDHGALLVKFSIPAQLAKYLVNKGYVTIDGMSITVIHAAPDWFTVTFIPHTKEMTVVKQYATGTWVNIEVDMMGKYIEKLLGAYTHVTAN